MTEKDADLDNEGVSALESKLNKQKGSGTLTDAGLIALMAYKCERETWLRRLRSIYRGLRIHCMPNDVPKFPKPALSDLIKACDAENPAAVGACEQHVEESVVLLVARDWFVLSGHRAGLPCSRTGATREGITWDC